MKLNPTIIKGVFIVNTTIHEDERGYFYRAWDSNTINLDGEKLVFTQFNMSFNRNKGVIRGMHMQIEPFAETKLVRCVSGKVLDVVIDCRKNSETFLQYYAIELSENNAQALLIPEGVAHGFQVLEENSRLLYMHTREYSPEHEFSINCQDPRIGIKWPMKISLISKKDQEVPILTNNFDGV